MLALPLLAVAVVERRENDDVPSAVEPEPPTSQQYND